MLGLDVLPVARSTPPSESTDMESMSESEGHMSTWSTTGGRIVIAILLKFSTAGCLTVNTFIEYGIW